MNPNELAEYVATELLHAYLLRDGKINECIARVEELLNSVDLACLFEKLHTHHSLLEVLFSCEFHLFGGYSTTRIRDSPAAVQDYKPLCNWLCDNLPSCYTVEMYDATAFKVLGHLLHFFKQALPTSREASLLVLKSLDYFDAAPDVLRILSTTIFPEPQPEEDEVDESSGVKTRAGKRSQWKKNSQKVEKRHKFQMVHKGPAADMKAFEELGVQYPKDQEDANMCQVLILHKLQNILEVCHICENAVSSNQI
jgi:hypothetical protein